MDALRRFGDYLLNVVYRPVTDWYIVVRFNNLLVKSRYFQQKTKEVAFLFC